MDAITDPKILAIMSKLNNDPQPALPAPEDGKKGAGDPDRPTRPPLTLEEFIKAEHLDDWPLPLTSEKFMGAPEDKDMIGSEEAIMKQLTDATPVDMKFLTALEDRLQGLEDRLHVYASQIVAMGDPGNKSLVSSEKILPSLGRTFMTDMQASDAVKVHPSRKSKKKMDFKESLLETKKKGVEYCVFPGFRHGELTELPAQLEAPQILNRVTKAQDFNPGFKKFWKKIFQSEASVAIMQDTFWWIFIDIFQQKKASKDKDHLFDRIADSFVALFTSIHPEIKDKFFQVYSDCLGQAVFAVFREAFPESDRSFGDEFKTRLLNVVSEWIAGIMQGWYLVKPKFEEGRSVRLTNYAVRLGKIVVTKNTHESFNIPIVVHRSSEANAIKMHGTRLFKHLTIDTIKNSGTFVRCSVNDYRIIEVNNSSSPLVKGVHKDVRELKLADDTGEIYCSMWRKTAHLQYDINQLISLDDVSARHNRFHKEHSINVNFIDEVKLGPIIKEVLVGDIVSLDVDSEQPDKYQIVIMGPKKETVMGMYCSDFADLLKWNGKTLEEMQLELPVGATVNFNLQGEPEELVIHHLMQDAVQNEVDDGASDPVEDEDSGRELAKVVDQKPDAEEEVMKQ